MVIRLKMLININVFYIITCCELEIYFTVKSKRTLASNLILFCMDAIIKRHITVVKQMHNTEGKAHITYKIDNIFCLDALNCTWSTWTIFSTCSHSCGGGTKYRTRNRQIANSLRQDWLPKTETDIQPCNTENCIGKTGFQRHTLTFNNEIPRSAQVRLNSQDIL